MKMIMTLLLLTIISSCGNNRSGLEFSERFTDNLEIDKLLRFEDLKSRIIEPHCLTCHKRSGTEDGIAKWVVPGNPEESKLYQVIKDGRMPKKAAPLSTADLEFVRKYILDQATVTFEKINSEILGPSCVSCHKRMTSEESLMKWINLDDPFNSPFYRVVKEGRMPKRADPLPESKQQLILNYLKTFVR